MEARTLWIGIVCLLGGTLLSALHLCLGNLSATLLQQEADRRGRTTGERARQILADLAGHARAVAMGRVACNLGLAIAAVWITARLRGLPSPVFADGVIGLLASVALVAVFGVAIPEAIAAHAAERFVLMFGPLLRALYMLQLPLMPVARLAHSGIRWVAGPKRTETREELAGELLSVVEAGEREGAIDENERRMIEAVVNFKERTVEQIMTPRTEVEALEMTGNLGVVTAFVRKARHSRIPVIKAGGTLDDVVGFFYVKDLLRWLAGDGSRVGGFDLKHILRPAIFVPATKTIRALAEELVDKKVHIAVVADEFGNAAGLVTLEDIIEEVFGEIQDEYEKPEDEPPRIELTLEEPTGGTPDESGPRSGVLEADARAYITDVNHELEPLGVALAEDDEYDTLGGFITTHLGRMPETNESFAVGRMQVTVVEATPTRVVRARINVRPEDPAQEHGTNGMAKSPAAAERPD